MSQIVGSKQNQTPNSRQHSSLSIRDDMGSVSPFTGKVRKKPTILIITEDLKFADELSLQADKQALVMLIFWSLENMLTGYNPSCDVLILDESMEEQLSNPSFSRILKKLINIPTLIVKSHVHEAPVLSPLSFVYKRLQQSDENSDVITQALEAYHQFHELEAIQN